MSKEITITIHHGRNKEEEYQISIVPNRFTVDFYDYIKQQKTVMELTEKLKTADTEELMKIQAEMVGLGLSDILDNKYKLIKTIMIANDYDFDRDFWDLKVSPLEVDEFIGKCAMKDQPEQLKKKLSQMLPSTMSI